MSADPQVPQAGRSMDPGTGMGPGSSDPATGSSPGTDSDPERIQLRLQRRRWPLKTLVEILPVIIALTALFSWTSIRRVSDAPLVMLPMDVIGPAPGWMLALLVAVALVMFGGMGWLLFIYTRAPVNAEGPAESHSPFSPEGVLSRQAPAGPHEAPRPDSSDPPVSAPAPASAPASEPAGLQQRPDGSQR